MKVFLAAVIIILLALNFTPKCGSLDSILNTIFTQHRLGFLAQSIDNKGIVHLFFISRRTRGWAEVVVDDNINACIISKGTDFYFALERQV